MNAIHHSVYALKSVRELSKSAFILLHLLLNLQGALFLELDYIRFVQEETVQILLPLVGDIVARTQSDSKA